VRLRVRKGEIDGPDAYAGLMWYDSEELAARLIAKHKATGRRKAVPKSPMAKKEGS
jgi:hypothetical protein